KLADDDLVMYDRQTGSDWKQSRGTAISGELEGETLEVLPASMLSYGRFVEAHPDGVVLQPPGGESEAASDDDTPARIRYELSPYDEYFEADGYGLGAHRGTGGRDDWAHDAFAPKDVVIGLEFDEDAIGVPRPVVDAAGGVVQVTVGDRSIAVFSSADGVHAFFDRGLTFEPTDTEGRFRADGTTWDSATGEASDGRQLQRAPARRLFAFT
ncbi:MAG: DUF3179 domain-containing (seleno)protein, partial [Halobacteriales archaeon]